VGAEDLVPLPIADEESGDRAVAEVEHEPRAVVRVIEEV
jgi:hypothetical protein